MDIGAYERKHSGYHRSVKCSWQGIQLLWNLWELYRITEVLQICPPGVMEEQETQRPDLLAYVLMEHMWFCEGLLNLSSHNNDERK